ncbi:hypothetical protein NVP1104O_21 [Vibrio phage 1.104.O._10N.286.49.A12]|nr:hypothetical protein NVP1104O_21 [Vibrio phage 1.104.O._10N.286.49.A12]
MSDKYLVQVLERNEHFCKMFKLVTMAELPLWLEEANAVIDVCIKRHPKHLYAIYISNNPVDLAKGESRLIQQEAIKKLKGECSRKGITTSTKAMYLGMGRSVNTFDFDTKDDADTLRKEVIDILNTKEFSCEYTNTPNGVHVHLKAIDNIRFMNVLTNYLKSCLDKIGHDVCSPIEGTYKGDFLISKGATNQ